MRDHPGPRQTEGDAREVVGAASRAGFRARADSAEAISRKASANDKTGETRGSNMVSHLSRLAVPLEAGPRRNVGKDVVLVCVDIFCSLCRPRDAIKTLCASLQRGSVGDSVLRCEKQPELVENGSSNRCTGLSGYGEGRSTKHAREAELECRATCARIRTSAIEDRHGCRSR